MAVRFSVVAAVPAALSWARRRYASRYQLIATRMAEVERSADQTVKRNAGLQIREVVSA